MEILSLALKTLEQVYHHYLSPCFNDKDIVRASVCPSICLSHYLLLNHCVEF